MVEKYKFRFPTEDWIYEASPGETWEKMEATLCQRRLDPDKAVEVTIGRLENNKWIIVGTYIAEDTVIISDSEYRWFEPRVVQKMAKGRQH